MSAERLAEASVWVARLHSGEDKAAAAAGVQKWLKADPANGIAFERCTDVWEESIGLRRVVSFSDVKSPSKIRSRRLMAAVAASIATIVITVALLISRSSVTTGIGEQRLMTLKDGSRIFLNTATRLDIEYTKNARTVRLQSGEALFEVAKRPDWPFIVKAGNRRVTALGTSFVVRYDERQTAVTLVEGKVTVTPDAIASEPSIQSPAAETFTLHPGQRLTFTGPQAQLDATSLERAVSWRQGLVVLDDTPLSSAVAEMNRYNATKLVIERPETGTLVVNGLFQTGDSLNFARAVAQTYGLHVIERDETIVLAGVPAAPSSR